MATEHENTSAEDQALADEWAAALEETGDVGQDDIDALLAKGLPAALSDVRFRTGKVKRDEEIAALLAQAGYTKERMPL